MTKTDLPKAINLRELDTETAAAILEIQTSFSDSAASKAVVRAVTRYMPLYRENRKNQEIIREKENLIREQQSNHRKDLQEKDKEISDLKDTIYFFFQAQRELDNQTELLKKLIQ